MGKGIRVNALAKELAVDSKSILEKLRNEGLTVPNHQSTVSLGLAETIREWFAGHDSGGGWVQPWRPLRRLRSSPRPAAEPQEDRHRRSRAVS